MTMTSDPSTLDDRNDYLSRDRYGMYGDGGNEGPGPRLMGADTLLGNDVYNNADEDLGDIKEIMLDMQSGEIAYAVLAFGGFLGMGEKLFAVPWRALTLDTANHRFTLDVSKDKLKDAPGFDADHWPDMADSTWSNDVHSFYGVEQRSSSLGSTSVGGTTMGATALGGTTGGSTVGGSSLAGGTTAGGTTGGSTTGGVY